MKTAIGSGIKLLKNCFRSLFMGKFILLLSILRFACISEGTFDDGVYPVSAILQLPESRKGSHDDVVLECTSWRVAGEANNLRPWKTIPEECVDYVKEYMTGRAYAVDLETVSNNAAIYARIVNLTEDGKDSWIFDVDETLLSNLPYYAAHGYGLEIFDSKKFDEWVETGMAPALHPSLKLYEDVLRLGFKVILLTGRSERHRNITVENLTRAGFKKWDKLILRSTDDQGKTATKYKSDKRTELIEEGYRILGNSGDQWSDLLGSAIAQCSFKLPNPMYYIP